MNPQAVVIPEFRKPESGDAATADHPCNRTCSSMRKPFLIHTLATRVGLLILLLLGCIAQASAHPLGNFTVNRYSRIMVGNGRADIRYVVDLAEIPAMQALLTGNSATPPTGEWLNEFAGRVATQAAGGLELSVDGVRHPVTVVRREATAVPSIGGTFTLRIVCDFTADIPTGDAGRRFRLADRNEVERIGWREMAATAGEGVSVFDSTVYGNGLTDELRAYPENGATAPLAERVAEFSYITGAVPAGHAPLRTRDGATVVPVRDRFADLIAVPVLTPGVALLGLLLAFALGGAHALSPGHGKTVVGAYLVGSRGTPKHAAFLGLTVTVTHTAGVFLLGIITLFASKYILPERLFPILGLVSGVVVTALGMNLIGSRWRAAFGMPDHHHDHPDDLDGNFTHTHDGVAHSHLPPGADGAPVTWRSLLALGVTGGLLPCPSALVVLLSAVSLNRVGYGLLLVVAFSLGLAGVLTAIGLAFVYTGRLIDSKIRSAEAGSARPRVVALGRFGLRFAPVVGAVVITLVGVVMCIQVMAERNQRREAAAPEKPVAVGFPSAPVGDEEGEPSLVGLGIVGVLGLGLVFGLKHATEADHVVAVSTIVSEHRNLFKAALVGGLWGIGHTFSIVVVGFVVLLLRVAIPKSVADWLEFGVAFMIIGLGVKALANALMGRGDSHPHSHSLDKNDDSAGPGVFGGRGLAGFSIKPLLVGAAHGLAGSAALTLLVLSQIPSILLGVTYLAVFGLGTVAGMLLMSGLIGIPFILSARGRSGLHYGLRIAAGLFSTLFGLWYAYTRSDVMF